MTSRETNCFEQNQLLEKIAKPIINGLDKHESDKYSTWKTVDVEKLPDLLWSVCKTKTNDNFPKEHVFNVKFEKDFRNKVKPERMDYRWKINPEILEALENEKFLQKLTIWHEEVNKKRKEAYGIMSSF